MAQLTREHEHTETVTGTTLNDLFMNMCLPFFLAIVVEGLSFFSRKIEGHTKLARYPIPLSLLVSSCYAVQMAIAYYLMILAMSLDLTIYSCVIIGFFFGHLIFFLISIYSSASPSLPSTPSSVDLESNLPSPSS